MNINFQQIFEDEVNQTTIDSLEWANKWYDLSNQHRLIIEELITLGYNRAVEDALDPEVMSETADLSIDMAAQLRSFSEMLRAYTPAMMSTPKAEFQTGNLVEVVSCDFWCLGLFQSQGPEQETSFYLREVPVKDLESYGALVSNKCITQIEGNLCLIVYVSKNRLNQTTGYGVLIKGKRMFCKYQLAHKYLRLVRTHDDESRRLSKI